jgi:hypothetical protein
VKKQALFESRLRENVRAFLARGGTIICRGFEWPLTGEDDKPTTDPLRRCPLRTCFGERVRTETYAAQVSRGLSGPFTKEDVRVFCEGFDGRPFTKGDKALYDFAVKLRDELKPVPCVGA